VTQVFLAGARFTIIRVGLREHDADETGEDPVVPRIPTAVLSTGMMLVAVMSFVCGLILDTVTRGRREIERMHYLLHAHAGRGGRQ
jgi:hypothetical protein